MKNEKFLCKVPRHQETASASRKLPVPQKNQGIVAQPRRPKVIIVTEKQEKEYEKAKKKRKEALKKCGEAMKDAGKALGKAIEAEINVCKKDPKFPNNMY